LPAGPNEAQAERWGGTGGAFWVEHEAGYDRQLEGYGAAMLAAAELTDADAVLDVGCGTGTTALQASRQAAHVLGVDLSPVMIARARARAADASNVRFELADAQVASLAPHDVAISRFGLMFFDDPRAAFANLRAAADRLATVCWQGVEHNDWMGVPAAAMGRVVPVGDIAEPGLPGPFSLASRDQLVAVLVDAGWVDVRVDAVSLPVPVGGAYTLDDAAAHVAASSLGRSLLAGVDEATAARALDEVRDALAPFLTDDGVVLSSAAWLVRASGGQHRR
jgi:SAM-dependent methyltransferase